METNTQGNGPRVEFGSVTVLKVVEGMSNSSDIAVVQQEVSSIYPAASAGNDKVDALFASNEFGDGQTYTSKRTAIVKVPKGTTAEQVATKIAAHPNARIYRILSHDVKDVLTNDQISMVEQGLSSMTFAQYEEEKAVKDAETGAKILHNGQVQYRSLFFATSPVEDIDNRSVTSATPERTVMNEEAPIATEVPAAANVQM